MHPRGFRHQHTHSVFETPRPRFEGRRGRRHQKGHRTNEDSGNKHGHAHYHDGKKPSLGDPCPQTSYGNMYHGCHHLHYHRKEFVFEEHHVHTHSVWGWDEEICTIPTIGNDIGIGCFLILVATDISEVTVMPTHTPQVLTTMESSNVGIARDQLQDLVSNTIIAIGLGAALLDKTTTIGIQANFLNLITAIGLLVPHPPIHQGLLRLLPLALHQAVMTDVARLVKRRQQLSPICLH